METTPLVQPSAAGRVSTFPSTVSRSSSAASDLLGLSITAPSQRAPQPIGIPSSGQPIPPTAQSSPLGASLPLSCGLRRRPSETASPAVGSPGRLIGGMEKKKLGGGGSSAMARRASEAGRGVRKGSNPPAMFDFRSTDTPSPLAVTGSLPAAAHMPVVLQPGDGEDGEILGEEADAIKSGEAGEGGEGGKARRRRSANVFRCESCSKIYRHPSCLVKHRWQHSPAWQESSKFLVSKHQQVQMLEAATILVHLQPGSLPEDKSYWPAAISPESHPMPSISFNDSRFISRQGTALSLAQAAKAAQAEAEGHTHPGSLLAQGMRHPSPGDISTGSGEETSAEGSSPPSSLEEVEDDEDDDDDDDGDLEMDFGEDDSPKKVRKSKATPAPSLSNARRQSFGSVTAVLGNLAIGSIPKTSSPLTQSASNGGVFGSYQPGTYSPHYQTIGSFTAPSPTFAPSSLLSRSLSGPGSYGTAQAYSPYSTSPALPHPSSSLRGGPFDDDSAPPGSPYTLSSRFRGVEQVVEEEEEDFDEAQVQRRLRGSTKEGSGERDEVYGLDDMDL